MKTFLLISSILIISHFNIASIAQDYDEIENSLTHYVSIKGEKPEKFNILERMKHHNVPGVSVVLMDGGKIVWAKTWGQKDASTGEPVGKDTLFQAASISKPITAIAAMRLVEEGLLSLDDPINDYLKRWKVPQNNFTEESPVTLRGLLTHTAGTTVSGFPGYNHNDDIPTVVQILNGMDPSNTSAVFVDKTPGGEWRYSGGGYTIAQLAMEDVTGLAFADLMRKYVLDPFAMQNSTFQNRLSPEKLRIISAAHNQKGETHGMADKASEGKYHLYPELAAAGLWTNPTELASAIIQTNHIYHQRNGSLLNETSAKELFKNHQDTQAIGYGLEVFDDEVIGFGHGGSNQGYRANLTGLFDGRGLVMMTNGANGSLLMDEIFYGATQYLNWPEYPLKEMEGIAAPADIVNKYSGTYHFQNGENTGIIVLANSAGGLVLTIDDFIKSMKVYQKADAEDGLGFFVLTGHEFSLGQQDDGTETVNVFGRTFYKID